MTDARAGESGPSTDFIRAMVEDDLRTGKHGGRVATRFPPEPNGYLHLGHAKSICLNFGVAAQHGGTCNLRMDDTDPSKESIEYVESIQRDVRWLGFDWADRMYYASDYFEQLYAFAVRLIERGLAYVCSLSEDDMRLYRGTISEPGRPSPYRERTAAESLDLFARMRAGEFPDGAHVLRARIDMAAPNMKLRDPPLYRIRHAHHYRTGEAWCIYPLYDFTHCLSDALEGITHSLCTLEFTDNRALYDWVLEAAEAPCRPQQIEFARLNLGYTVLSKRKLLQLVEEGHVRGWDDPRMPTLCGARRRGYTPEALRSFCDLIGVAKSDSVVDMALLEHAVRDDLNRRAPRVLAVLDPLKVVIHNLPEGSEESLDASYFPPDVPAPPGWAGPASRALPFGREIYIERSDFLEEPPPHFHRLAPGREVRLRHGYIIRCDEVVKDAQSGQVQELRCSYDPATRGAPPDGRKVRGTIHWVAAAGAVPAEVRLYDRLFVAERPAAGDEDYLTHLNPDSLRVVRGFVEPSLHDAGPGSYHQFERHGYFTLDADSRPGALVFNRTVALRDSWAKLSDEEAPVQKRPSRASRPTPSPARATADPRLSAQPGVLALAADLQREHGLSGGDALTLASDAARVTLFTAAVHAGGEPARVASFVVNELLGQVGERPLGELPFGGAELGELVTLVADGTLSATAAKQVLAHLVEHGGQPRALVAKLGMEQLSDHDTLAALVGDVVAAHPDELGRYRSGKVNLLGFFVGQVMKRSQGKANPALVKELLQKALTAGS